MIKNIISKIVISFVITFVLAYFLLSQIKYEDIFFLFAEMNYGYVFLSFIFYFLLVLVRALRIKNLVGEKADLKKLTTMVLINHLFLNLLPFRTGELSLPLLLKKYSGIEKKEGFFLVFYLRIIDTIIVLIFLFVSILLFSGAMVQLKEISYTFVSFLLLFFLLLFFRVERIILFMDEFSKKKEKNHFFNKISSSSGKLLEIYRLYKNKETKTIMLSVLIFMCIIFVFGFMLKSYPINLTYADIILISLTVVVITSLPFNGIAGIGTVEFGVSYFLMSRGIEKNLAIGVAFNYHFVYLLFIIFFGSLSYFYLEYMKKRRKTS